MNQGGQGGLHTSAKNLLGKTDRRHVVVTLLEGALAIVNIVLPKTGINVTVLAEGAATREATRRPFRGAILPRIPLRVGSIVGMNRYIG